MTTNFGLKDRPYGTDSEFDPKHEKTQWQRFEHRVAQLNHEGGSQTQFKVLYSRCWIVYSPKVPANALQWEGMEKDGIIELNLFTAPEHGM